MERREKKEEIKNVERKLLKKKSNFFFELNNILTFANLQWRGGWVAESGTLLRCYTRKGIGGSNPPLSAPTKLPRSDSGFFYAPFPRKLPFKWKWDIKKYGWESAGGFVGAGHPSWDDLDFRRHQSPSYTSELVKGKKQRIISGFFYSKSLSLNKFSIFSIHQSF